MSVQSTPEWTQAEVLAALPAETQAIVRRLMKAAGQTQSTLHLVGGPVRDLVLGRPVRDVDLLVESADPEFDPAGPSPARILAEHAVQARGRVVHHGRFGTVRFEEEGAHVDLASARVETYRRPGALPDVTPAGIDDDLGRRDFSVNAMAIELRHPGRSAKVELRDPFAGLADLAAERLRILHQRSFHDDPTRALRAARLAGRLGFSLERSTRSSLRAALRDGAFGAVSGERLRREVQRCFSDAALGLDPAAALRMLDRWHVLPALEPGLELPQPAIAPLRRFGRLLADPLWKPDSTPPWQAGMAIWLAALPPALGRRTLHRLSIRGDAAERIMGFRKLRDRLLPKLAAARGRGAVDELLASVGEDGVQALWAWGSPSERKRLVRWAAEDRPRRSPVNGTDLTGLGLAGPDVGRVLARVRAAHLDGDVANREEALALATELARRPRAAKGPARRARPRKRAARKKSAASKRGVKKVTDDSRGS